MTWEPTGIVAGDAFREYVSELRERDERCASGGGNAHTTVNMNDTTSDEDGQVTTNSGPDAAIIDEEMSRRAFAAVVGAAAATAAGAGTAAAQEETELVPDFSSEYTPIPRIEGAQFSIDEHTPEMSQLEYVDNDGDVQSLADVYGAILEPAPDDEDETHNPVSFHPSMLETDEYTDFPRGVTREDADGDEEDVSALDAEEWTIDDAGTAGTIDVSDASGDALSISTTGQTAGDVATATFSNFMIDSGEARKVLQLVLDVDELEAGAQVSVSVVDAMDQSVSATIDPDADAAAVETIATEQGAGVVYQTEIGEFDGGADLDTIEEIVVEVAEANASLTVHGMNLELDSAWSFGTRQVYDDEDEEVTEETLVEPTGRTGIVSLTSLTNQFTDATVYDVEYNVELLASESPASNWDVTIEEVERGSYALRFHLVGALELPGGLYEVEVIQAGELVDEVRHPSDVYRTVEYAHDLSEIPTYDDVDDIEWTDATSVLEDGDMGDEVTLSTTVSAGDTVGIHYDLTEDEEIVNAMAAAPGGGGAAAMEGGGGIMSNLWAWGAAVVTGVVIFAAGMRRRAASAASGVRGGN